MIRTLSDSELLILHNNNLENLDNIISGCDDNRKPVYLRMRERTKNLIDILIKEKKDNRDE